MNGMETAGIAGMIVAAGTFIGVLAAVGVVVTVAEWNDRRKNKKA